MKVLVACEFSGVVRDVFKAKGHYAMSCDLLPTEREGLHYQGDVRDVINDGWDLMIAHPPCTYLCSMGIWWNAKRPERWDSTYEALDFVKYLWGAPINKIAIENPIGYLSNHFMKPAQIINPWMFGQEANKPTCLWLKNLPLLLPTSIVGHGEFYTKANGNRMSKWSHITSGTRKEERARIASRTFQGIADAMAEQWGAL
jgi:hypothetical protein